MAYAANEPVQQPLENHFDLVKKAIDGMKQETTSVSGILGNRFSTRFRIIDLLEHYYQQPPTLFFDADKRQQLKYAIDDIYNYQLLEGTKFILGRMLRSSTNDDIVESVLEMHKNGTLCRIDEDRSKQKDPTIICSMGLKSEK